MPTCTAAALINGCFSGQAIDAHQWKAILVYLMALELNAIGGTDYTTKLVDPAPGGLLGDANELANGFTQDNFLNALLSVYFNNATAAGGAPSSDIQVLAANTSALYKATEDQLNMMILLLQCELGTHDGG